jgi:hypothetical protein
MTADTLDDLAAVRSLIQLYIDGAAVGEDAAAAVEHDGG